MSKVIQLPFHIASDGSVSHTSDESKMWQDRVLSAVMTRFNERVMKPSYGSGVGETVFSGTTDARVNIRQAIETAFSSHLPFLTLNSCDVYEDIEDGEGILTANIEFSYPRLASQAESSLVIKTQYLSRSGDVLLEVSNVR